MQRKCSSPTKWLACGLVALGLIFCPAVRAQDEESGGGDSKGWPLEGYIATSLLCGLALFIVVKTARR